MASLMILGNKSITITNRAPNKSIRDESIFIENKCCNICKSYVFFDLRDIPVNSLISSAQLVLFRKNYFNISTDSFVKVYPLKDDFSTYTTYKIQPEIYKSYKKIGKICMNKVSTEVDITEIVKAWLDGTIINKGLAIQGAQNKTPLLIFGSDSNRNEDLMPIIRIVYECNCNCDDNNNSICYLPVTINYSDYRNPAKYTNKCKLIIAVIVTIGNKKYRVSKEYDYIPSEGIDIINVAYVPQANTSPIVSIACSYNEL